MVARVSVWVQMRPPARRQATISIRRRKASQSSQQPPVHSMGCSDRIGLAMQLHFQVECRWSTPHTTLTNAAIHNPCFSDGASDS